MTWPGSARGPGEFSQRKAATELREAFGVRGIPPLSKGSAPSKAKRGKAAHSKRFAWQFRHRNPRRLRTISTMRIAAAGAYLVSATIAESRQIRPVRGMG